MGGPFSQAETKMILKGCIYCSSIIIAIQPHGPKNFASVATFQRGTNTTRPRMPSSTGTRCPLNSRSPQRRQKSSQTRRDIAKFHCTCPKKHRHNRLGHWRLGGVKASGEPVPSSSTADPVTGGIAYTYPYHCEQVLSLIMSISTPWHPSKGQ
ncbi:hypothetical protein B0H14DRAFT_120274 [Mycena olivaceomarginata]|nr:hypothetical protein B0H14DRAFT_120274 [Mycena olivaceomarginata]